MEMELKFKQKAIPVTFPIPPLKNDLLLRAINRQPVPRVPVWMMRQAGRSDPEYRAYRERVGLSLYELFRSTEHAIAITKLPQRIGVDALIVYQDILTPLEPMGAVFHFTPGPELAEPLRHIDQVSALKPYDPGSHLGFFSAAIQGVLQDVAQELPLLGFAGAPFTLAAFMIEGKSPPGRMEHTFRFISESPEGFASLMDRLTAMTLAYLNFQAEAGVHAVQLFESVGHEIPRDIYETYVQPSHERIFGGLPGHLPGILFVRESPFPDLMVKSGAAVLSLGQDIGFAAVRKASGGRLALQGNVDNRILLEGTPEEVEAAVKACLAEGGGTGHILNLSHGLLADTPFENVKRFVRTALETPARTQNGEGGE